MQQTQVLARNSYIFHDTKHSAFETLVYIYMLKAWEGCLAHPVYEQSVTDNQQGKFESQLTIRGSRFSCTFPEVMNMILG